MPSSPRLKASHNYWLLLWWLMPVGAALASCGAAVRAAPVQSGLSKPLRTCLLVDTDAALDDFRAMAALAGNRRITAVIVTEGIATPQRGAMAVAHLLAADRSSFIPVLVGATTATLFSESWLGDVRANAERLNGFLSEAVALTPSERPFEDEVRRLTSDCAEVNVVVLGPWTSFMRYAPNLGSKLREVVTQGIPLEDLAPGNSPGFNCRYDIDACHQANQRITPGKDGVWVEVPRDAKPPHDYAPTAGMISALTPAGLPGTLRVLLQANATGWQGTLMSDDSVVVYVLHPEAFGQRAHHVEPKVPPEEIRTLWLRAVNKAN